MFVRWGLAGLVVVLGMGHAEGTVPTGLPGAANPLLPALQCPGIVEEFYQARNHRPAWIGPGGSASNVPAFLALLGGLEGDGLDPGAYHRDAVYRLIGRGEMGTRDLAVLDLLLTDAYFSLGRRLAGRALDPSAIHGKWTTGERRPDPVPGLREALDTGCAPHAALEFLVPREKAYRELRDALAVYRARARAGAWFPLADIPVMHPGDRGPMVALLRVRMIQEDAAVPAEPADAFDPTLEAAVNRFQERHGLDADGIVGPATRAALDVSPSRRVEQISLNLERLRWSEPSTAERALRVNVPDFHLRGFEGGRETLRLRVVVGRPDRPTPVLTGRVTWFEVNPCWNVPQKLARLDLLPRIHRDADYLASRGIRVFETWRPGAPEVDPATVAWDTIPAWNLAFKFQQAPGDENPLGRIKFMFDNPFRVYLHDTPARHQFTRSPRAFSSGCVRVEDPASLAVFLMGDTTRALPDTLAAIIDSGETRRLSLARGVPVEVEYATAWIDEEGILQFRDDVYGYDAVLAAVLNQGSGEGVLPGADRPGVQVDEAGARVVADAAGAEAEGGPVKVGVVDAGKAHVDRLAGQVEAAAGRLASRLAEHLVGPWGAVAGDDLERLVGVEALRQGVQLVEQDGIDGVRFPGPVVAQDPLDGRQAVGQVITPGPVGGSDAFAGVDVAEGEDAVGGRPRGGGTPEARGP